MNEKIKAGFWSIIALMGLWVVFYIPHYFKLVDGSWYSVPVLLTLTCFLGLLLSIAFHYIIKVVENLEKRK